MITKAQMMDVLLSASPTFAEHWDAFRREWTNEAEEPPLYLALSGFARHIIAFLEAKDDERLRRIFESVERLHVEGDEYVREAATVGLLENLQNSDFHRTTEPEQFRSFLHPASLTWWDRVDSFWKGSTGALQEDRNGDPAAG